MVINLSLVKILLSFAVLSRITTLGVNVNLVGYGMLICVSVDTCKIS
jgi:hypothetical protein